MQWPVTAMATPVETALVAQILAVVALAPERRVCSGTIGTGVSLARLLAFATPLLQLHDERGTAATAVASAAV